MNKNNFFSAGKIMIDICFYPMLIIYLTYGKKN